MVDAVFCSSMGAYTVRLNVTNGVGHAASELQVFVLQKVCKPPQVRILGSRARRVSSLQLLINVRRLLRLDYLMIVTWTIILLTCQYLYISCTCMFLNNAKEMIIRISKVSYFGIL